MEETAKLIEVIRDLYETVGPVWAVIFLLLFVGGPVAWSVLRDRSQKRFINIALEAKEASIQRLANDNREWRGLFFSKVGLSEKEIAELMGDPGLKPNPHAHPGDMRGGG